MRSIRMLVLIVVMASCTSPEEPVETPHSISALATGPANTIGAPQFEIAMPVPQYGGPPPITWVWSRILFKWQLTSAPIDPTQVRWIVVPASEFSNNFVATLDHIRSHPNDPRWSPWVDHVPAHDQGTSWYSPFFADGRYVFALQARVKRLVDNEFDTARNVRFLEVNQYQEHGPLVRLSGTFLETFETTGTHPLAITELAPGTAAQYVWTADASYLGTEVATFRYGWDVVDYDNDSMWAVPLRPYDGSCRSGPPRVFSFGSHIFTLEVRDTAGNRTWAEVTFYVPNAESFYGALDILPGTCENTLNAGSNDQFTAVLASTVDFDVLTVDVATIRIGGVAALKAKIEDVVTAEAPNYCECLDEEPDGRPDLVLVFDTDAVLSSLVPTPQSNSNRMVWCVGEMDHPEWGRHHFSTASCVDITGLVNPHPPCRLPSPHSRPTGQQPGTVARD